MTVGHRCCGAAGSVRGEAHHPIIIVGRLGVVRRARARSAPLPAARRPRIRLRLRRFWPLLLLRFSLPLRRLLSPLLPLPLRLRRLLGRMHRLLLILLLVPPPVILSPVSLLPVSLLLVLFLFLLGHVGSLSHVLLFAVVVTLLVIPFRSLVVPLLFLPLRLLLRLLQMFLAVGLWLYRIRGCQPELLCAIRQRPPVRPALDPLRKTDNGLASTRDRT